MTEFEAKNQEMTDESIQMKDNMGHMDSMIKKNRADHESTVTFIRRIDEKYAG